MNDNTILRIKVPAHLYESVKEQLTINEAAKAKAHYGAGMEVVKEKKMKVPKDGMKKVEEEKQEEGYMGTDYASSEDMAVDMVKKGIKETDKEMEKKTRTLDELKKAKDALDKKINEMEGMDKVEEIDLGNLMDPNFIGGVAAILGVGVPLVAAAIKDMKKAKTPEEKAAVRQKLAKAAGSALSGDM
jgi:hypothetical protein